jgi:hypothetical protein
MRCHCAIFLIACNFSFAQLPTDSSGHAKYFIDVTGFRLQSKTWDDIPPYSVTGRSTQSFITASFGAQVKGHLYAGTKLQYHHFSSIDFWNNSTEQGNGFMAGAFIGLSENRKQKLVHFNARILLAVSNIRVLKVKTIHNIEIGKVQPYYGLECEIGLHVAPRLIAMFGLSLNNFFVRNREFNFPYLGLSFPLYQKDRSLNKSLIKYRQRNLPMY